MPLALAGRLATAVLPLALAASAATTPTPAHPHAAPYRVATAGTSAGTGTTARHAVTAAAAYGAGGAGSAAATGPRGNPKAYAFLSRYQDSKAPVARWNPCGGPIDYRVNLAHAPKGSLTDVKGAIQRVSSASGLRFRYRGTTNVFPWAAPGYRGTFPADTELVIAWAVPGKQSRVLPKPKRGSRGPAGLGSATWYPARNKYGTVAAMIVQGQVVLDATLPLKGGFATGPRYGLQGTRGKLLMHEIGHAIGLDHPKISDSNQVMYPLITRPAAAWGAGDRKGLKVVGSHYGCLSRGGAGATAQADSKPGVFLRR